MVRNSFEANNPVLNIIDKNSSFSFFLPGHSSDIGNENFDKLKGITKCSRKDIELYFEEHRKRWNDSKLEGDLYGYAQLK